MISIIVATDKNLLIGKQDSFNGLPWSNKEDLQHFKSTTLHQTILMGLNTYKAIGRPLPNRKTIVVSDVEFTDDRVEVRNDLIEVLKEYKDSPDTLYICGGASIYRQSLKYADELLLSRIPGEHTGETYFPEFKDYFTLVQSIPKDTFTLEVYRKHA